MRLRWTLALIAPLFAAGITLALALDFPTLTGRVVDDAGILDAATRDALTQTSSDLEAKTTDQLVVVTLKSLQGTSIEDYGYQLGRVWQIGQKGKNNGVLLIVAPNERKVRIEVGYGLEGTLTDAITKYMIERSILPRFKANDFPGGIRRGVDDIVQALTGNAEEWKQRATPPPPHITSDDFEKMIFMLFIVGIVLLNFVLPFLHMFLIAMGVAQRNPKSGFWYWLSQIPSSGSSSGGSGGFSSGSSSSSGGGFSGGGGSFGGGGSSGSW